jgi:hypothetical protein
MAHVDNFKALLARAEYVIAVNGTPSVRPPSEYLQIIGELVSLVEDVCEDVDLAIEREEEAEKDYKSEAAENKKLREHLALLKGK